MILLEKLKMFLVIVFCLVFSTGLLAQTEWSAATHRISIGDFNDDGQTDLLVIAKDAWRNSGIVLSSGGVPSQLSHVFPGNYMGIDWAGNRYQPVVASVNAPKCISDGCGGCSANYYYDDVILLDGEGNAHHVLTTNHLTVKLDNVARSFIDPNITLDWSQDKHRVVAGELNMEANHYDELFFQPQVAGQNAYIVRGSSATVFDDPSKVVQTISDGYLGFNWAVEDGIAHIGNFNGDSIDDVLIQGRSNSDQFGVAIDTDLDIQIDSVYLTWSIDDLVPDWSADNYNLLVGNFDGDAYDDVLLQPKSGSGPVYIVLFKALDGSNQPTNHIVSSFSSNSGGLDWTEVGSVLHVGDFDNDGKTDIYYQSVSATVANQIAELSVPTQSGQLTTVTLAAAPEPPLDPAPDPSPTPGTAVGHLPGQFSVNHAGAATYQIPLALPPGVRGMQPDLTLNYSSGSGNGLLGVGWGMSGLSTIERCEATIAIDGFADGVDLQSDDNFCLNGKRLIETQTPGEYRTEIESFQRVRALGTPAGSSPGYFQVEDKNGLVRDYGRVAYSSNSRIHPTKFSGTSAEPLVYAISRITDQYGNSIQYNYGKDYYTTEYWPTSIEYSNSAGAAVGRVVFGYTTSRSDYQIGYFQGFFTQRSRLLKKITTYARGKNGSATDIPVAEYHLDYEYNQLTNLPHLTSAFRCDPLSGKCVEDTQFKIQTGSRGFVTARDNVGVIVATRSDSYRS